MKKFMVLLLGLVLILTWSCEQGVQNDAPYDFQQTVNDIQLLSASSNGTGFVTYKILLPSVWETNLNGDWKNIGISIGDEEPVPLYSAQNGSGYQWEYTTADADIFINFGHWRREGGKIIWANRGNLPNVQSKYFLPIDGNNYVGLTFRNAKLSPIVLASLTKLEAKIDASPTETVVGTKISFDGSRSTAQASPLSKITNYLWDFGDGVRAEGLMTTSHSYQLPGDYIVSLTIKDNAGNSHTAEVKIKIMEMAHPGEVGDDITRFSFDYQNKLVRIYTNFTKCQGSFFGKSNVYGNFNGPESVWKLFYLDWGLKFDSHHNGWGYIELPMIPIMAIKYGFSAWYDGPEATPSFVRSNFNHMKPCIYYNGQDFSVIIYSSGLVTKGP